MIAFGSNQPDKLAKVIEKAQPLPEGARDLLGEIAQESDAKDDDEGGWVRDWYTEPDDDADPGEHNE